MAKHYLYLLGYNVWFEEVPDLDSDSLAKQQASSVAALQSCRVFLSFLNEFYLEDDHKLDEFHLALLHEKKIVNLYSDSNFYEFIQEIQFSLLDAGTGTEYFNDFVDGGGDDVLCTMIIMARVRVMVMAL